MPLSWLPYSLMYQINTINFGVPTSKGALCIATTYYVMALFHRLCIHSQQQPYQPMTIFSHCSICRQPTCPLFYWFAAPNSSAHARSFDCRVNPLIPPRLHERRFSPTPPAHNILAKCDTFLKDLVMQQRELNKIFAEGGPMLNRSAGRQTPKQSRSHSCRAPAPAPGDFVESLICHMVQSPALRQAPLDVATKSNNGPLSNVGPVDSPSLH
jgi:hypothetical protein